MAEDREFCKSPARLSDHIYDALLRHRLLAVLLITAVTLLSAAGLLRLEFDNSNEIWFVDGDPALLAYREFLDRFGSDESMVLLVDSAGDPFSPETLRIVNAISARMLAHPEIGGVWSLTHARAILDDGHGGFEVRPLLGTAPRPEEVAAAHTLIRSSPLYRPLLSDEQGRTAILLKLKRFNQSFEPKAQLVRDTRRVAKELGLGRSYWLAGSAAADEALYRYSARDSVIFAPILLLVLLMVLGLLFRSALGVVLPIVVVAVSLVWALGFAGWMGWRLNIVTTTLPPLLMAVGIADTVHLLQELRTQLASRSRVESLRRAFRAVLRPCLLTTLTTAAGMASLLATSLASTRQLGVTAAIGVLAAFLVSMIGATITLQSVPEGWLQGLGKRRAWLGSSLLTPLAQLAARRSRWVLLATVLVMVAAALGVGRLEARSSMASYFHKDDPIYREVIEVDRSLGGTFPFEVLVESTGEGSLIEPETLRRVNEISNYLESLPMTGTACSYVDFIVEARRGLGGHPPGQVGIPESRAEVERILQLMSGDEDLARFLTSDHRSARIQVGVQGGLYQDLVKDLRATQDRIASMAGPAARARITGLGRLMSEMERYLLSSQIRAFLMAFGLILTLIAIFFLSWRVGLLSAVPNLLPILLVLGLMGWVDIALDVTTIMLTPLLMGLVVDDTVHMLERTLRARGQGMSVQRAFHVAIEHVGSALVITSIILAAGFATMVFGVFRPNVHFGVLAVVAIGCALVSDLLVLPAVASVLPALLPRAREKPTPSRGSTDPET